MDGWLRIGTKLDTNDFDSQIKYIESQMEEIEHKLKQADMGFEVGDTVKLEAQYEKLSNQLTKLNNKKQELNRSDLKNFESQLKNVGKETGNVIKKIAKWSLAIFGIRAAYNFVRQSVSTLAQYNDQLADDLEYIRFAMASALQPVIETLVSLVYKLLQYVNYIAQAWFGVNLFANATADAMNKTASSAKEVKKSLAGFDEMNVVSSGNDSSSVGGIDPSVKLNEIQGEPPAWLKFIAENKDIIIGAIAGITAGILALQLGLKGIQALGIGIALAGIIMLIQDIIDFINDPSWEGFFNILGDIAIVIGGIMLVMGNWWGLLVVIIGAVVKLVADNWETIWKILKPIAMWVYDNVIKPIWNGIKSTIDTIVSFIKTTISVIGGIFTTVISLITNPFIVAKDTIVGIFNGIKTFFDGFVQVIRSLFNGDLKGVFNGFKTMFKGIMDSLWSIVKAPLNLIIGGINSLIKGINKINFDVPDWVPGIGGKKLGFNIKTIPKLASGGIINNPGKGVPLGAKAIGGEVSREGVLPLTDSQAMEELGSTIGRYVTIHLTNITQLDNRQLAREQKKINAQNNFAMNR